VLESFLSEATELVLNQAVSKSVCSYWEGGGHLSVHGWVVTIKKPGSPQQPEIKLSDLNVNKIKTVKFSRTGVLVGNFEKNPLRGTKILFGGRGLNFFFHPFEVPILKQHIISSIFFFFFLGGGGGGGLKSSRSGLFEAERPKKYQKHSF